MGGASCPAEGCPGLAALPPWTARPCGLPPGPTTHWRWVRWAGLGARSPNWAHVLAAAMLRGVLGFPWHLLLCRGSVLVVRASGICGTRWPLLFGTCPCVLVVVGCVPLWRASRPGRSPCFGWLFVSRWCLPLPGAFGLQFTGRLRGACGGWLRTGLMVSAAGPCRGRVTGLPERRNGRGLRWGCPWHVAPSCLLGCVRCGRWAVRSLSLTRLVSCTVCLLTGDSAAAPGLFRVEADTSRFGS